MDPQDTINQREWDNLSNWTGPLGAYSSKVDTRLWVPKRVGTGQALNFAHPGAKVFLAGMCIVPLALLLVVIVALLTR
jgi:uncharacterized membrane protein